MSDSMLLPGDRVPALRLPTLDGRGFDLFSEKPSNFTMIVFHRGAHCPDCMTQLEELASTEEEFSKIGTCLVAVSMDEAAAARNARNFGKLRIAYGLSLENARRWGLFVSQAANENEPARFVEPAVMIVRSNGELFAAFVQSVAFARPRTEDILSGLSGAVENDSTTRGTLGDAGDGRIAARP